MQVSLSKYIYNPFTTREYFKVCFTDLILEFSFLKEPNLF